MSQPPTATPASAAPQVVPHDVSWRIQAAVYGVGLFSTSIFWIESLIVPLYAATMSPSPLMFGLVSSASHILPLLLSIHTGAMMDRLGARQVMLVCAVIGALAPLLAPLLPFIGALIVLQMFFGVAESQGWLGAQAMIGQYMHGKTLYAGRMSSVIRIGQFFCAPLAGVCWDLAGPWGGFLLMSLCGGGSIVCALLLPKRPVDLETPPAHESRPMRLSVLLPKSSDYVTAFRLLRFPAVVIVVILGSMLHVGNSIQSSFYVAWLRDMGLTGTAIGLIAPASAVGAALFSLMAAPLMRLFSGLWIALLSLWAGILFVCVTPLLGSYLLLQVAMVLRSGATGLAQPLVITLVLRGAGRENQGKAIGLRGTANRIAAIISPLAMGAIAELIGLEYSFYVTGALASLIMIGIGVYLWRNPKVAGAGED